MPTLIFWSADLEAQKFLGHGEALGRHQPDPRAGREHRIGGHGGMMRQDDKGRAKDENAERSFS